MLKPEAVKGMKADFAKNLEGMLDLVARGRGIEILLRIADQTREGLTSVSESYESMMKSDLKIPNLHPPKTLPRLFSDRAVRSRLEAARDVGDKLAHGLYRQAHKLIDKYQKNYGLKTKLTANAVSGWRIDAGGHLVDTDGRRIESIVDMLTTSDENLIYEEFEVFVGNNYDRAAREIFDDAWKRITADQGSLALGVARLEMFRDFRRGKRQYAKG
jgi:hypothetical protein